MPILKLPKIDPVHTRVLTYVHLSIFLKDSMAVKNTHSKLRSGNSRPRQGMKEDCNIFIRREQVPQAKNRFVRLLNGP